MSRDNNRTPNDFYDSSTDQDKYDPEADQGEWEQPVDDFQDNDDVTESHSPQTSRRTSRAEPEDQMGDDPQEEMQQIADDEATEIEENEQPAQQSNSSGGLMRYLPAVGGVLALLAVGFFGWQQMSGMMGGDAPPPAANEPRQAEIPNPVAPPPTTDNAALPPPVSPQITETISPQPQAQPPSQPAGEALPQQPAAEIAAPQPVAAVPVPPPADTAPHPSAPQPVAPASGNAAELTRELEEMRASHTKLNEQIQTLQQQADNAAKAQAEASAAQETIKSLQDRLNQLESSRNTAAASDSGGGTKKSRDFVRNTSSPRKTVTRSPTRETESEAVRLQREVNARFRGGAPRSASAMNDDGAVPVTAPVTAPVQPQEQWVLRSAQPGSAWLSLGGSNNLRRVVVGDKVQGLGTVTAIRQVAGRWVIDATQGAVR